MKKYGTVYKIVNKITNRCYVGLTTKTVAERLESHLNRANREKSYFQTSLKHYGKENFEIIELFTAFNRNSLIAAEKNFISQFNTLYPNGYNLTIGGDGIVEMTKEIRDRISCSKKGKPNLKAIGIKRSFKQRLNISRKMGSRPVLCREIKTDKTFIINYVTEGKKLGFNPSLISAVIYGKRKKHKGYTFKYLDNANTEGEQKEISDSFVTHRDCPVTGKMSPRASESLIA